MPGRRRKHNNPDPIRLKNGNYGCPEPGCDYEHRSEGAVYLHGWLKHYKDKVKEEPKKEIKNLRGDVSTVNNYCCNKSEYVVLKRTNKIQIKALDLGYSEVCINCGELRK